MDLDDRSIGLHVLDAILSAEERERATRFIFEADAWRFKVGRAMLRTGLALHLEKLARTIQILTAENGKPFVESGQIRFNVSHSEGQGLIAFTRIGEIGVDIEAVELDQQAEEIASAYFTESEAAMVASEANETRADCFTRLWTRKEAVLKATGGGILDGLSSFDISGGPSVKIRRKGSNGLAKDDFLLVKDLEVGIMKAAIAGPNQEWSVKMWPVKPRLLWESLRSKFPHLLQVE